MPIKVSKEDIGFRLRAARLENSRSQVEMAKEFGLCRQAVAAWESGASSPTSLQLARLCIIYGRSADEILFGMRPHDIDEETAQQLELLPPDTREKVRLLWSIFGRPRETVGR